MGPKLWVGARTRAKIRIRVRVRVGEGTGAEAGDGRDGMKAGVRVGISDRLENCSALSGAIEPEAEKLWHSMSSLQGVQLVADPSAALL